MPKTENSDKTHTSQKQNTTGILIVDSSPRLTRLLLESSARKGIHATLTTGKKNALDYFSRAGYHLVLISLQALSTPEQTAHSRDAFQILRQIKENSPELPVIMIADPPEKTDYKQIVETAVHAIRAGCRDFLLEPLDAEKIETLLDTFSPNHDLQSCDILLAGAQALYKIVGRSAELMRTVNLAKRIAPTSVSVMISGESGTGKELISNLIHHHSRRADKPCIKVNCAALSDSLLESELFGHEKGAFTGAYAQRKGRFEMAHGGTLLLDEVTETPLKFQAKLLRVIENQNFERVGGSENVTVNVRIISTTNKDLSRQLARGRLRHDLYYRLNGVRLNISPLRDRPEDLADLVWHFVNLYACQVQRAIKKLDPAMMDIFAKYHWPGNVRQLRNVVLTSLILGTGSTLSLADVSWLFDELQPLAQKTENDLRTTAQNIKPNTTNFESLAGIPLVQIERHAILQTLRRTSGNQTKAAKALGISDRTLRDKLRRYRQQNSLQPA